MKLSIAQLQAVEIILNAIYSHQFETNCKPVQLVLSVDGILISGQLNYYKEDSKFPIVYSLGDNRLREETTFVQFDHDLRDFVAKNCLHYYHKNHFKNPETLLDEIVEIVQNRLSPSNSVGTLSLKNVTVLGTSQKLPFLKLTQEEYHLLSILVDEQTLTQNE